ncbi:sacsin N-terminal ATP-binding-like domain-containing protein, partial [Saccharomonospora iraqiensis]|uniref:sacsin N-terminal ATP-binding-like domain-containing protein n=1 Tax=Saccharomonospora iraqiensis TaxID=52698 RepID=UPI00389AD26D
MPRPESLRRLRETVLRTWRDSPTRLTEDTNSEHDLRAGAYRDRLFVELAQNAADAAARSGRPGRMRVRVVDGELRVANTGVPLDDDGVAALASLRASDKDRAAPTGSADAPTDPTDPTAPTDPTGPEATVPGDPSGAAGVVGRFGVGFAAVLTVTER